jgi:intracellular septation protein A
MPLRLLAHTLLAASKLVCNIDELVLMKPEYLVLIALTSIVLVGLVGIPFGDPRFIPVAVLLELVFIGLAVLVSKGYTRPLYICIILASLIIIGNSITTAHIHRMMMTFVKPVNTIVLIIGGYILQALLIYASVIAITDKRRRRTLTASSSY